MRSRLLAILAIAAVMPLIGCSRRSRATPSPEPAVQAESPGPGAPTVAPAPTATRPLTPPAAGTEAPPPTPAQASGVPLGPLWDDLEAALAGLDSALAEAGEWEATVP